MEPNQQPYMPQQPSQQPNYNRPVPGVKPKQKRSVLFFVAIGAGLLAVGVIAVVLLLPASQPKKQTPATDTTQSVGPEPATAIGIEGINNQISQDISSVNDEKDFPAETLSDKSLGL